MKEKKYIEFNFKTREEWKFKRRIGGSDLACIMGQSKRETINDLFTRLVYPERYKAPNLDDNPRVQEGAKAEEFIRELWTLEHPNYKVINPPKENWLFIRKDNERMSVSPDGLLNDYTGALEFKDCEIYSKKQLEKWESGEIPRQYYYQIMQYFIVINTLEEIYLTARLKIMNNKELDYVKELTYHFTRKNLKEEIKECEKIEKAFIEKYILTKTRPNENYLELLKGDLKNE